MRSAALEQLERDGAQERALLTLLDTVQVIVEILASGQHPNKKFEKITIEQFNIARADLLLEEIDG